MNLIDAEKLIAEIERRIEICEDCEREGYPDTTSSEATLKSIHSFIASLQQEQMNAYDAAMLEVKEYVDKLYDEAGIGTCEYDSGFYNGIIETCMKLRGFIKARTSKDQPEVDLENGGWIDCRKQMPKETKQWSDTLQGRREWTESDLVLAWDSMYGCRVDATKNGKWMSEQKGGYTGQVVHSIIAWRSIPKFNEELLFSARKEEVK